MISTIGICSFVIYQKTLNEIDGALKFLVVVMIHIVTAPDADTVEINNMRWS